MSSHYVADTQLELALTEAVFCHVEVHTHAQFCTKHSRDITHPHRGIHTPSMSPAQATVISQCPQDSDRLSLTRGKGRVTFLVSSALQSLCCILHKITTWVESSIPWAQTMLMEPSTFLDNTLRFDDMLVPGQYFLWDTGTSSSLFRL